MRAVHKYPVFVAPGASCSVKLPAGAKPVLFGKQGEQWCLWAEVETDQPMIEREVHIVGTGWDVPVGAEHVSSWQDEPFVWHAYLK